MRMSIPTITKTSSATNKYNFKEIRVAKKTRGMKRAPIQMNRNLYKREKVLKAHFFISIKYSATITWITKAKR